MLLVGIRIYLKSLIRYKLLILNICLPNTLYVREQGCEDPGLFFEETVWKTLSYRGPNTTEHDFATFYAVWVTSAKFSLYSASMKYCTQNEE